MIKLALLGTALCLGFADVSRAAAPAEPAPPAWRQAKAKARRWTDSLLKGVAKSGKYDVANYKTTLDDVWRMCANIERAEFALHKKRLAAVPGEEKRSKKILELNLLYVYGNIIPRLIDESTALAPGRAYAGTDLAVSIEERPYREQIEVLQLASRAPPELMPAMPEREKK
ncbi:MAG: hypothetical protein Q8T11_14245 [Elusimicrobiota bacterium]|nr:hypothetical protein [Elusimicrobiota bacterium]